MPPVNVGALHIAAETLRSMRESLPKRVSDRCFSELESYRRGEMPREESVQTVVRLLDFLVDSLASAKDGTAEASEQGSHVHSDLVRFEEGIAARRVKLAIEFEDLIRGLQIMRAEVWAALSACSHKIDSSDVFELEKRVNFIFDAFFLGMSSSYRKNASETIEEQAQALEKWEEVVKAAAAIHLQVPSTNDSAKIVRLQAEAIARRSAFSEDEIYDIITAVGEVCDNCIEHGASPRGIDVNYTMTPTEFKVDIKDYGKGFDPTGMGEEPPDLFSEDGRGLFLMKQLMDSVEIHSRLGHGTHTIMTKLRGS